MQHIKHFKLKSKELDQCKKGLEGEICYHQVKEELEKLRSVPDIKFTIYHCFDWAGLPSFLEIFWAIWPFLF